MSSSPTEEFWIRVYHRPLIDTVLAAVKMVDAHSLVVGGEWQISSYPDPQPGRRSLRAAAEYFFAAAPLQDVALHAEKHGQTLHWSIETRSPLCVLLSMQAVAPVDEHQGFFCELANKIKPDCLHYLPMRTGPVGFVSSTLEMALQRDKAHGQSDRATEVARALGPLLPRLTWDVKPGDDGRPSRLGWLNYWSARAAQGIGFPDPQKDERLMPLVKQLDGGAWFVRLTEDPLDLERPDHVEALAWAYWRFDKIGKRMTPTTKTAKPRVKRSDQDTAANDEGKRFALRERDENGQWWDSSVELIVAASAEDALRIYFARTAYSRKPKSSESLRNLSNAYDEIAAEVGLTRAKDIEAVELQD